MVGRRTHQRQTGRDVHAVTHRKRLERRQPLVVVHGKDTVKVVVHLRAEKSVCGIGTKSMDALVVGVPDCRRDFLSFFRAQQTAVAGMRIERQDCYPRD